MAVRVARGTWLGFTAFELAGLNKPVFHKKLNFAALCTHKVTLNIYFTTCLDPPDQRSQLKDLIDNFKPSQRILITHNTEIQCGTNVAVSFTHKPVDILDRGK